MSRMATMANALQQRFMPKHNYSILHEENKALVKLKSPIFVSFLTFVLLSIFSSTAIGLKIVFPSDPEARPFCKDVSFERVPKIAAFYWIIVFVPSVMVFMFSALYLVAGINVAYDATRHSCLKVVENNWCAPNKGRVRCLFIIDFMFAIILGILALILGPLLLLHDGSCSVPLFWCYEIQSWGLVILNGVTASLLRKKAAVVVDDGEGELAGQIIGLEMLEVSPVEFTPDVERRVDEGFRSWMGTLYTSSSDDEY